MATTLRYPTVIDAPVLPTPTNLMFIVSHAGQHDFANTAIVALENMVGVTGTGAPTGTAMYGLFNTGSVSPGHKHKVTDITGDSLGPTGPTGHAGPTGPINYTGPTGPQGVTGPADGPTGPTGPSGGGGGGGAALTVNSGEKIDSGLLPLQLTKQALVQPSGIPQPLPPLFGFQFPGTSVVKSTVVSSPTDICAGRDGAVWACTGSHIYRVIPTGTHETIHVDTAVFVSICSGPDGNIWAVDRTNKRIRRITLPTHSSTFFDVPTGSTTPTFPQSLCSGPDGNLWIGCGVGNRLVRMSVVGTTVSATTLAGVSDITDIGCGPDGNVYLMTQSSPNYALWKVTPALSASKIFTLGVGEAGGICAGPDGNLWIGWSFTSGLLARAVRIAPTGANTTFTLGAGLVKGVVAGGGGDLWYAVETHSGGALIKITIEGAVTSFPITTAPNLRCICVGDDGAFWAGGTGGIIAIPFLFQTGGVVATTLSTTDPHNKGQFWNTGGVVHVSAG